MKNEAFEKIQSILAEMRAAEDEILGRAESVADEFCESFSYGEYGSGRTYFPKGTHEDEIPWDFEDEANIEDGKSTVGVWVSSSEMC